ncbi:hypothetical protein DMC30DRAFT_406107 [Rhodotorula diobovata]|uniref:Uncharacterized protein n=1 Tax=Rhodotorula diobovata TaxID=5288 RepID=A0A5C5FM63_9BASI|nr:hypothetical protein DMC30DRAFT_406107 [Rhodotorula diobovata]
MRSTLFLSSLLRFLRPSPPSAPSSSPHMLVLQASHAPIPRCSLSSRGGTRLPRSRVSRPDPSGKRGRSVPPRMRTVSGGALPSSSVPSPSAPPYTPDLAGSWGSPERKRPERSRRGWKGLASLTGAAAMTAESWSSRAAQPCAWAWAECGTSEVTTQGESEEPGPVDGDDEDRRVAVRRKLQAGVGQRLSLGQ